MNQVKTYGAEIEKTIVNTKTGAMHRVSQDYFARLAKLAKKRNAFLAFHESDIQKGVNIGVTSRDLGEQGLDNGFNLLETSLAYQPSLNKLFEKLLLDLKTTQSTLQKEHASVINLAIYPLGKRDFKTYQNFVAPKGIYPFIWYRGWDHTAGIDARSQNSPTTGVNVFDAADAVSVIIGAGAAFIGIFGNSPYAEGKLSGFKESRCMMWEKMMKFAKSEGDRVTARFPEKPFRTLAQYFNWMFGKNTAIHFVLENLQKHARQVDYKSIGDQILILDGNPPLLEFFEEKYRQAYYLNDLLNNFPPKTIVTVSPDISQLETLQFTQFIGARIRFGLKHSGFPLREFTEACKDFEKFAVEKIFSKFANFVYIEGRDTGANFPDQELYDVDPEIARTTIIGPQALQAGLLNHLNQAKKYLSRFNWLHLKKLRGAAIKDGLQGNVNGVSVYEFTKRLVEIAEAGVHKEERKYFAYIEQVLKTKQNGADRAIDFVVKQKKPLSQALIELVKSRSCIIK